MSHHLHSPRRRNVLRGAAVAVGALAAPIVSKAQTITTIINPNGQAYIKYPADTGALGSMYALPDNPVIRYCDVPLPSGIPANHSRLTFAVDVCTVDEYFSTPLAHIVVTSRVNMSDYLASSFGNAWQGIIAGGVYGSGKVLAEERLFPPPPEEKGNIRWETGNNAVGSHKWYRFVVDTVKWMGYRMFECRVYDVVDELNNTLGPILYYSPSLYYPDSGYADTNTVVFANVSQSSNSLIVGRIAAHWTLATEWVEIP